jgi:hypothetical protein
MRNSHVITTPQAFESGLHRLSSESLVLQFVLVDVDSPLQALISSPSLTRWCFVTGIETVYNMSVCCPVPVECQVPLV